MFKSIWTAIFNGVEALKGAIIHAFGGVTKEEVEEQLSNTRDEAYKEYTWVKRQLDLEEKESCRLREALEELRDTALKNNRVEREVKGVLVEKTGKVLNLKISSQVPGTGLDSSITVRTLAFSNKNKGILQAEAESLATHFSVAYQYTE